MKHERRSLWSQTGPESKADTALASWVASVRVSREGPRFRHLGATLQRVVRGRGATQQAHSTHVVCHKGRSLLLGARQHCPAVGPAKNTALAPGATTARFKEGFLLQCCFGPEKQDQWIYGSKKSGWSPAG